MSSTGAPKRGPWHEGEIEVQTRAGVRQDAEQLSGMYKRQVPASMAEFLAQQQFAVLSTVDANRLVWASLVTGAPGMIQTPAIDTIALIRAKLETLLPIEHVENDERVGLIVIDFSRRIRVRINGRATVQNGNVHITIDQLYGNCSQYIQRRVVESFGNAELPAPVSNSTAISKSQAQIIGDADTFFVASRHPDFGADASHRGGKPGFVQVSSPTRLSFPDYPGNKMFNTLGNLAVNPAVGLLFVDFEAGTTLQLSGRAVVDWNPERSSQISKAQRVIDIDVLQVRETTHATSLRFRFIGYSPTLE